MTLRIIPAGHDIKAICCDALGKAIHYDAIFFKIKTGSVLTATLYIREFRYTGPGSAANFTINFCPFCGAKLTVEGDI